MIANVVTAGEGGYFQRLLPNLGNGVVTFVLGMGIVFCMLALLIFVIKGMTALMVKKPKEEKKPVPAPQPADPLPQLVEVPAAPEEDEDEIIAVIAAAVAAMGAAEGKRLSVRSFRRVGSQAPAWNRAGRQDIIANRF